MRFEYYHSGLDSIPKLSVDGTVSNSIHFSHWQGNETPPEVKADTSTEIALNLVSSSNPERLTQGIELVTNNHFDTDGVLSVWTVLTGERALDLREKLISAAEAGDFSEFSSELGVKVSIVIQGPDQASSSNETGSPLARELAGEDVDDDARAYELVLPEVARVFTNIGEYEPLWHDAWRQLESAIESFESGRSQVKEYPGEQLTLITLAPEIFSQAGLDPTQHTPPNMAISRYARGKLFLIATPVQDGWVYRLDYPYYSWAETVKRPRIERRNLTLTLERLNEIEPRGIGQWKPDAREMTSAAKFLNEDGTLAASRLQPDNVARICSEQPRLSATVRSLCTMSSSSEPVRRG
ncbi:MAG TPA: DUF6687 family protein [Pyrinomonadaceae bacterium]|nr:DUF6687 family protein [Pyrinomonadaceae bacterium]